MDHLYPDHYKALKKTDLALKVLPTFKEVLTSIKTPNELKKKNKRTRSNKTRQTYFCLGISDAFKGGGKSQILLKNTLE